MEALFKKIAERLSSGGLKDTTLTLGPENKLYSYADDATRNLPRPAEDPDLVRMERMLQSDASTFDSRWGGVTDPIHEQLEGARRKEAMNGGLINPEIEKIVRRGF